MNVEWGQVQMWLLLGQGGSDESKEVSVFYEKRSIFSFFSFFLNLQRKQFLKPGFSTIHPKRKQTFTLILTGKPAAGGSCYVFFNKIMKNL